MDIIDFNTVSLWDLHLKQIDAKEEDEALYKEATEYILFYDWCISIKESFIGIIHPPIVAVFLFEIDTNRTDVDNFVWVIVGDLPPAYITIDDCQNPALALNRYIGAMEDWVEAAEGGKSVLNLIPVNVPASKSNANALKTRLKFLDERVLVLYKDFLN